MRYFSIKMPKYRLAFFFLIQLGLHSDLYAGVSQYLSPQAGVNAGKKDKIHLRAGLTLKCCSRSSQYYGNITGLGAQIEFTPYRYSLQAGLPIQYRQRKSGYWGVRPYYFWGYKFSGEAISGAGIQASTPYGGLGIEFEKDQSQLLFVWDY